MKRSSKGDEWILDAAVASEKYKGCMIYARPGPFYKDHPDMVGLNGYAIFPKRLTVESGYSGVLTYVPVHGGITLAEELKDGRMIYGFDTGHCDSDEFPRRDPDWILGQCRAMVDGVKAAAKIEARYLKAEKLPCDKRNEIRAKLIESGMKLTPESRTNFGIAIRILSGEL